MKQGTIRNAIDPFLRLIVPLQSPAIISGLILVGMLLADFVPSIAYKRLFGTSQLRGFLDDWNFLFVDFVLIPSLAYWYVADPTLIIRLWNRLEKLTSISIPEDTLNKVRRRWQS